MGAGALSSNQVIISKDSTSTSINLCNGALGNGGSGSQAILLPSTTTCAIFGGGASVSLTTIPDKKTVAGDLTYFSTRLSCTGGPLPTVTGHTLTGLMGNKAMLLGGLAKGRRGSGFGGGFANFSNPNDIHPSLCFPDATPVKTSLGSGWVLTLGGRRNSASRISLTKDSKPNVEQTTAWTRQYFLGQPPIRRAFHSAHRVLVGGIERIIIYGGEVGSMLSRPTSNASSRGGANQSESSGGYERGKDESQDLDSFMYDVEQSPIRQKRRINQEERLRERIAQLQRTRNSTLFKYSRNADRAKLQVGENGGGGNGDSEGSRKGYVKQFDGVYPGSEEGTDNEFVGYHSELSSASPFSPAVVARKIFPNSVPRRSRSNSISYDMDINSSFNSNKSSASQGSASAKPFPTDEEDDDGFLFVLDTSSWVWTAGTCATETFTTEEIVGQEGEEETSSRSFFPPARARHTITNIKEDGTHTIMFGGYKTKASTGAHQFYNRVVGDNNFGQLIGTPLNDAWQLRTVSGSEPNSIRFLWRRMANVGAPPSGRWGHTAVSVGYGAMVLYGGSDEFVEMNSPRKDITSVSSALDELYVFHLRGIVDGGGGEGIGEGLWVRVPGSCGLGKRVGASGTCVGKSMMIFGGCRGTMDDNENGQEKNFEKFMLKDGRHVNVNKLLGVKLQ